MQRGGRRAKEGGSRTDSEMALLDEGDSLFQRLAKLEAHEHDGKAAAAKRRDGQRLALQQALFGGDQPHAKELVDEEVRRLGAHGVVLLEELELRGQLRDLRPACSRVRSPAAQPGSGAPGAPHATPAAAHGAMHCARAVPVRRPCCT